MTLSNKTLQAFLGVFLCLGFVSKMASGDEQNPPPNSPPTIVGFTGVQGPTMWTFQGRVSDEEPLGLIVTFGGLLEGHSTTVTDPDGYFWYSVELNDSGTVTAQTEDSQGLDSNLASYLVI